VNPVTDYDLLLMYLEINGVSEIKLIRN